MKTISFIIPVFNEEKRLKKTFLALKKLQLPYGLKLAEVIFVNDGSKDRSKLKIQKSKVLLEKILNAKIKLISYSINQGKGYAIKQGMSISSSDYTLFFDADISTPLVEINKFMPYINKGIDVIIGTRKNGKSTVIKHQPLFRELLGKGFTLFTKLMLGLSVTDFTCGFKAFSKKARLTIFPNCVINRWGYDAEVIFLAKKYNISVVEKAVIWSNDKDTKVNLIKAIPQTLIDIAVILKEHVFESAFLPNLAHNKNTY